MKLLVLIGLAVGGLAVVDGGMVSWQALFAEKAQSSVPEPDAQHVAAVQLAQQSSSEPNAQQPAAPITLPIYLLPGEDGPIHWWDGELSTWAANPARFEGSTRSISDQEAARPQAEAVFNYCMGRQYFAQLHDCRCVAGHFIDAYYERIAAIEGDPGKAQELAQLRGDPADYSVQNSLVGIADNVADQCPFRPGSAKYQYDGCVGMYRNAYPDIFEEYCTCTATEFADVYMSRPVSDYGSLAGYGTQASIACTDRGVPSPFNR
jgi:hypothetical protein